MPLGDGLHLGHGGRIHRGALEHVDPLGHGMSFDGLAIVRPDVNINAHHLSLPAEQFEH